MIKEITAAKVDTMLEKWFVREGEEVKKGDPLCQALLGTIHREVGSKEDGTVLELLAQPGDEIPGGSVICRMEVKEQEEATAEAPPAGTKIELLAEGFGGKAVLKEWKVAPGDSIPAGAVIAVLAAGKLNKEIQSPYGGTILSVEAELEAEVESGSLLAILEGDGTAVSLGGGGSKTKVLVVGGGPGGYVAAIRAAQLGGEVCLIEKREVGGTCLNEGCIPTKALMHSAERYLHAQQSEGCGVTATEVTLDWEKVQAHRQGSSEQLVAGVAGLLAANGVELIRGSASFVDANTLHIEKEDGSSEERTGDKIILATGASTFVPPIPGLEDCGETMLDSAGALCLPECPASLLIIGGGVIGIELACAYAAFGTEVTIVEMLDRIMPVMDRELTEMAQRLMEEQGIRFHLSSQVTRVAPLEEGVQLFYNDKEGQEHSLAAERLLVAVGRRPYLEGLAPEKAELALERGHIVVNDQMESSVPGIYAIGDCAGRIMLAHAASTMGEVAAENALGQKAAYSERVCPACVYMFPEFAGVGMTEEQVKEKGYDYKVGRFPLKANGKAVLMEEPEGTVKILSDSRTGHILGGHILGARATDLIGEIAMAMQMHGKLADLTHLIHPHPTLAEAIHEAALDGEERAIHFK